MKYFIVDLIINDCCLEFIVVLLFVYIIFMMYIFFCLNYKGIMKISFISII